MVSLLARATPNRMTVPSIAAASAGSNRLVAGDSLEAGLEMRRIHHVLLVAQAEAQHATSENGGKDEASLVWKSPASPTRNADSTGARPVSGLTSAPTTRIARLPLRGQCRLCSMRLHRAPTSRFIRDRVETRSRDTGLQRLSLKYPPGTVNEKCDAPRTIQKSRLPGINPRYCPVIDHFSAPWAMDERLVSHQPGLLDGPGDAPFALTRPPLAAKLGPMNVRSVSIRWWWPV